MLYFSTLLRDFGDFQKGQRVKVVAKMHYGELRIKSLDDIHFATVNEVSLSN